MGLSAAISICAFCNNESALSYDEIPIEILTESPTVGPNTFSITSWLRITIHNNNRLDELIVHRLVELAKCLECLRLHITTRTTASGFIPSIPFMHSVAAAIDFSASCVPRDRRSSPAAASILQLIRIYLFF